MNNNKFVFPIVAGIVGLVIGISGTKLISNQPSGSSLSDDNIIISESSTDNQKQSYSFGIVMGEQIKGTLSTSNISIEQDHFIGGIKDILQEKDSQLAQSEIISNINNMQRVAAKNVNLKYEQKALQKQDELFANSDTPYFGSGEITLVEFFDYNCPHCKTLNSTLKSVVSQGDNIKVLYRPIGLMSKHSEYAAAAALAANKQNKFAEVHNAFISVQGAITEEVVNNIIDKLKLNKEQFNKDLKSSAISEQALANRKMFMEIGLKGVPSLFAAKLNGNKVSDKNLIYVSGADTESLKKTLDRLN